MKTYNKPSGSYISHFSNMVKSRGGINLAQGIPGFQPPQQLVEILQAVSTQPVHQYAPGVGNPDLLSIIAHKHSVNRDNLLVVQGATEGLSLVFTYLQKILGKGFAVASFEPAYESYVQLPAIFGNSYHSIPLADSYSFNEEALVTTIKEHRVKLVFLSSPGNPFGKVWSKADVLRMVELAEELDFYLVFDAVYQELYFTQKPYVPYDIVCKNLFVVDSFSKMLCITGWRIGYVLMHSSHVQGVRSVHDYVGLCAPSLLQVALAQYLAESSYGNAFVASFRERVSHAFRLLSHALTQQGFSIPSIDGGCFVWAKLPEPLTDGFQFASNLYETEMVASIPGEHFSKDFSNWIRFNVARPIADIEQAIPAIERFVKSV